MCVCVCVCVYTNITPVYDQSHLEKKEVIKNDTE